MNKVFCIFCLLLLLCTSKYSFSQSSVTQALLDSSNLVIHIKTTADSFAMLAYQKAVDMDEYWGQFNALLRKGKIHEYHYEADSAHFYYNKALNIAEKEDNQSDVIFILIEIAFVEESQGKRDVAFETLEKSLVIAKELSDSSSICQIYGAIGYFHSNGGNHEKSIENYMISLDIAEMNHYKVDAANTSQGIGIIYNKQKDFEKAEYYFKKAMDGYIALNDTSRMLGIFNDFGILNKNRGKYAASEKEYLKMLDIAKNPNYYWIRNFAHNNLGNLYFHMKRYEKGIENSKKGAEYSRAAGEMRSESDGLNNLAKNQLAIGLHDRAIQNATRSLQLAKEADVLEKARNAAKTLSEAYEKADQPVLALQYFKEHKTFYDSIYNHEKTEQIHGLEVKYATEKKDKEIVLLAKNAELEKVKNTRLWTGLSASILIGSLLFWFQMLKRKKEKEVAEEKRKVHKLENDRLNQELDFKKQELTSKVLQLCRKNEFLQDLDKQVKEMKEDLQGSDKRQAEKLSRQINKDMDADANWDQFLKSFESVHPDFNKKVKHIYPKFTASEMRMASLAKMNLGTKEIASLLNITYEGVKKTRYRMRKKMNIDRSENLIEHFLKLDITV